MNSDTYETEIIKFDLYEQAVDNLFDRKHPDELKKMMVTLTHLAGLNGEVGELSEKIKKAIRDNGGFHMRDEEIAKEFGDVEWYLTRLENDFKFVKNEILQMNVDKLQSRLDRGKLHGDDDNR